MGLLGTPAWYYKSSPLSLGTLHFEPPPPTRTNITMTIVTHRPECRSIGLPSELWAEIVKLSLANNILLAIFSDDFPHHDPLVTLYICKRFYNVGKVFVWDWFRDHDGRPESP